MNEVARKPKPEVDVQAEQEHTQFERTKGAHLWRPGQSGNPGGRPKGLAARIRETNPPERLAEAFEAIAYDPATSPRDRMEALRWLGERGYGKTPETHLVGALSDDQRDAAAELTREQLLGLIDAGPVLAALPSGQVAGSVVIDAEAQVITDPTE